MSNRDAGLQVEGARQLRRTLKQAGASLSDLKAEHAKVAAMVASRSTARAPRVTGALAASTRSSGTQSAAIVRAGTAGVPYAGPIHWGWPDRGIVAQPWIADTAADTQDEWSQMYLRALEHIIDQVEGAPGL